MNERIREIAEQADKLMSEENKYYGLMEYSEKFAELIIEECANVADENYIHRGSRTCGLAIRLHFGIEHD